MQEEDYTFVTIDSDDYLLSDAVVVDVEGEGDFSDIVMIDENFEQPDIITLSDETILFSDTDMMDSFSTEMDGVDISFMI